MFPVCVCVCVGVGVCLCLCAMCVCAWVCVCVCVCVHKLTLKSSDPSAPSRLVDDSTFSRELPLSPHTPPLFSSAPPKNSTKD